MQDIKEKLKDVVENVMIPEVEDYLEDLYKLLETNSQTEDTEYQRIYDYIMKNLDEHEHGHNIEKQED